MAIEGIVHAAQIKTHTAIAQANTLRALELRWGELIRERLSDLKVEPFTGRLLGELKHMVAGYGRDMTVAIMEYRGALDFIADAAGQGLDALPPTLPRRVRPAGRAGEHGGGQRQI